jgi:hypothetical protein
MAGTALPQNNSAVRTIGDSGIPYGCARNLAALEVAGKGQFVSVNSSGYAFLNDGTQANCVSCGVQYPAEQSDVSSIAGQASYRGWQGFIDGNPASTITNDGFTDANYPAVGYIANANTLGALAAYAASGAPVKRSIGGIVFGLDSGGAPLVWTGPEAWIVATALLVTQNAVFGERHIPQDAMASTASTETIMTSPIVAPGVVTGITITPNAALTADPTNNAVLTITKRDSLGVQSPVVVETATTTTAAGGTGNWTAWQPVKFTLSGTAANLNRLATDYFTLGITKGGAGVQLPDSAIAIIGKVG